MIFLKDALIDMGRLDNRQNPVPFSLTFCTANRGKKTGGEIIHVEKAVLMRKRNPGPTSAVTGKAKRRVNEFENATRDIYCLTTERPYRVHIRLIDQFNGTPIVW